MNKNTNISVITLGCARNTVDSQELVSRLKRQGKAIVPLKRAHTVIVNTCCFVADAKKESIDTILDLLELKKQGKIRRVVVAGCLTERYGRELIPELKGVDALIGVPRLSSQNHFHQTLLTPSHYAYVKICEGCYHCCKFCVIPGIKGKLVSRLMESVIREARAWDRQGVKEIILVGQDITAYGMDIYLRRELPRLLETILKNTKGVSRIRLLYTHPSGLTQELLHVMARNPRICRYLDMPLQHIHDRVLKRMGRKTTSGQIRAVIRKIRREIPGICLRTTFVVGLPGETEREFRELLNFIREIKFDKVGVFTYSREEGTPAYDMPGQVAEAVKNKRRDILMGEQRKISRKLQERFIGKDLEVLIDEKVKDQQNVYLGRGEFDAPEVDGLVYVKSPRRLYPGQMVNVRITDTLEYDLIGEAL